MQQELVTLAALAARWDTTTNALRLWIRRRHGPDSEAPIAVKNGRITADAAIALRASYGPGAPKKKRRDG
jgi:hypothetical protein